MKKQDFKVLKTKDLYPFPDNPFHVAEDETLSELAESIKEFGIVTPIITRPKEDGDGYEVIAGQRRVRASELAGINTVPAFVLPLDRDRAIITLVDSNLQRENILPSERAFAYKMKSEAMKRQGFRTDLTSSQVVTKLRTDDKVAQGFGVGRMTVQAILNVAESLGYSFRRLSGHIYEHPDHDSFRIFADTNTFKWFSRDIQGDVIDFVQLVAGVTFKEAVSYLETGDFEQAKLIEETYQPFQYYLHEEPFQQARIYLKDIRGLSDQTINTFGRQGLLAQATYQSEPVLVLKSYDHNGTLQAASLQGLVKNEEKHDRGYLKKIMKGSHGYVGISFDIGNPKRLIFCESVIDMMSYYQLYQKQLSDVRLISMEGLKLSVIAYQTLRLAAEEQGKLAFLDTVNPSRLSHYLQAIQETTTFYQTHSNALTLAVDNDEAGREFCQKLSDKGLPLSQDLPPLQGLETKSDWNDIVKQQSELSLSDCIQTAQAQVNKNHPPPKRERAMEL
ncbi:ParB/RepB/Spo0J family partition protein [Streptococcus suis]|nr:ParB/RepB/Spo0J family partition protein [Streptococcus suis]